MIVEFEFHKKTPLSIIDFIDKLKATGYRVYAELEGYGLEMKVVGSDSTIIPFYTKIYEEGSEDGMYEYQIISKNKDDFMKLYEIMSPM